VIVGASFAGIPTAQGLLKDILPPLAAKNKTAYKVVLISPSAHFYWKIGSPRAIINPQALPMEKVLLPIADGFKGYTQDKFEFVQAYVTSVDHSTKSVQTSLGTNVHYDSLVIASGTSFTSPIWSTSAGTEALTAAVKDIHTRLPNAKTVLVAGGGAAGVETAGELGALYGGKKDITLLSGSTRLLPRLSNAAIGKDAETRLGRWASKPLTTVLESLHTQREKARHMLL